MNNASVPSEVQLESWITEYGDAVLRTCYLYLGDRALAQDALQDTFIKVWRGMSKRRGDSAVKNLDSAHRHQHLQGLQAHRVAYARRSRKGR